MLSKTPYTVNSLASRMKDDNHLNQMVRDVKDQVKSWKKNTPRDLSANQTNKMENWMDDYLYFTFLCADGISIILVLMD